MTTETGTFTLEDLPESVKEEQLKDFLNKKIKVESIEITKNGDKTKAVCKYLKKNLPDITALDEIDEKIIPNTDIKIKLSYSQASAGDSVLTHNIQTKDFKEDEEIKYKLKYHKHIVEQFIKNVGADGLRFIDEETIANQRNVIKHVISKIGSNILSGSGIMNVSLPVNIFDQRSLLEVFAHQCRLTPYYLEKAGETKDPIEKLKLATTFAISRIHLSVTQLKPFNPIWGETFQCKIGDTKLYLEQSCHHPPIYHFLQLGKHFKAYGYQQPEASTGANSVVAKTLGKYTVDYEDGTSHLIYPCDLIMNGTLVGDRTYAIVGKFYIVDKKNGYISYIEFNPETRGFFGKMFSGKKTFPDFYTGCITRLDQTIYNQKNDSYTLKDNHTPLVKITGEWSTNCTCDGEEYWNYDNKAYKPFPLKRMGYTLPSDSTVREDCLYLKEGDQDKAAKAKVEMEEIQRRDRRLRAEYEKKSKK